MVKITRLVSAIENLVWKQGVVTGKAVAHTDEDDGEFVGEFEDEDDDADPIFVRTSSIVQMINQECRRAKKPNPSKERILAIIHDEMIKEPELAAAVDDFLTLNIDRFHEVTPEWIETLTEHVMLVVGR